MGRLQLQHVAQRIVLAEYLHALRDAEARAERLEREIGTLSEDHPQSALIDSLQCLRGVAMVTSVTVTAELGDLTRFHSAKQAMDYVGLVPSEHSSGSSQRRGSITKSGSAHARNALVEAAWHYRHTPNVGKGLRTRQKDQPEAVKLIASKAQHRLNLKYRRFRGRGKPKQVAFVLSHVNSWASCGPLLKNSPGRSSRNRRRDKDQLRIGFPVLEPVPAPSQFDPFPVVRTGSAGGETQLSSRSRIDCD